MKKRLLNALLAVGVKLTRMKHRKAASLYFWIVTPAVLVLAKPYPKFNLYDR